MPGSRPEKGSSMMSTLGRWTTARAMARRCFMPLEKEETRSSPRPLSPNSSISLRLVPSGSAAPVSRAKYRML
jgi:hypothetical protein